jgi:hypothetical protein
VAYEGDDHVQEASTERRAQQEEKMARPKKKMAYQKRAQPRK